MLLSRVRDNIHQVAAILQYPQFFQSQERSPSEVRFHAQPAVELNRMPYGFMNLQSELRPLKNDVESPLGTLISFVQRDRLFCNAARILHQFQLVNQLVTLVLPLPTERIRI